MTKERLDELKQIKADGKKIKGVKEFSKLTAKEKDGLLETALKMLGII